VRLLMLTGARRQELGSLTWSEINFAARVINLPASRVKNKKPHQIPLSQIAFDILAARQQDFLNHGDTDATSCSRNHQSGTFAGIVGVYQHHDFADTPSPRQVGHSPIDNRWTGEGCGSGVGAAIDACPTKHLTYLHTQKGASRSAKALGGDFRRWCGAAGLPKRCTIHGLRKASMHRGAEADLTTKELMALSGHKTYAEVQRYTDAADKARLARQAIEKLRRRK
jgi:integrase